MTPQMSKRVRDKRLSQEKVLKIMHDKESNFQRNAFLESELLKREFHERIVSLRSVLLKREVHERIVSLKHD